MPAFHDLQHYSTLLVAFLGIVNFLSCLGFGVGVLKACGLSAPRPWFQVQAALLGLLTLSLGVQLLAWAGAAKGAILIAYCIVFALLGLPGLLTLWANRRRGWIDVGSGHVLLLLVAVAVITNLLLAAAPSTKHDALKYHMLVPNRIILDGDMEFYLQPWPGAVLPQMNYSIAGTPLHALGYPDAPNVTSWCLSLLLAWFGGSLVWERTRNRLLVLAVVLASQVGLYTSVWHVTAGSHSMGDLATAALFLLLLLRSELVAKASPVCFVTLLSVFSVASAASKVSLLPVSLFMLTIGVSSVLPRLPPSERIRILLATGLPWLVFYLPLAVWTFAASGSPFGPLLTGVLAPSIYGDSLAGQIEHSRFVNQVGLLSASRTYLLSVTPLLWLGGIGGLWLLARRRRGLLLGVIAIQAILVIRLLPHDFRFLAGMPLALCVYYFVESSGRVASALKQHSGVAILVLLSLPWLAVQEYRAWPLVQVSLGTQTKEHFLQEYVALYDELVELDALLPQEAVLYSHDELPLVYSPRPIFSDSSDLPRGARVFALLLEKDEPLSSIACADLELAPNCDLDTIVFESPNAVHTKFRRPGRDPISGRLQVRALGSHW